MNFRRQNALIIVVIFSAIIVHAQDYKLSESDLKARANIQQSIKQQSSLSQVMDQAFSWVTYYTPNTVKWAFDYSVSSALSHIQQSENIRKNLASLIHESDNKVYERYHNIVGTHKQLPEQIISTSKIMQLFTESENERESWAHGRMSGAVYDGSQYHTQQLADFYRQALKKDQLNQSIFARNEEDKDIAVRAFKNFQTSNPLHGSTFPLAIKAMREVGFMLAQLINKKHAIPASSGQEALRLGIRALKHDARCSSTNHCTFIAIDDDDRIATANHSLNINSVLRNSDAIHGIHTHLDAAVLFLSVKNQNNLKRIIQVAHEHNWKLHIHLSREIFLDLLAGNNDSSFSTIFDLSPDIVSISLDTEGIIYNGISALIFSNSWMRYKSIEIYLDWHGGMYPAINSAGSIAGVDYIIAYLLMLHQGRNGLIQNYEKKSVRASANGIGLSLGNRNKMVHAFNESPSNLSEIWREVFSAKGTDSNSENYHQALVDINLSIIKASDKFSGVMTSGGTESIRLAVQGYWDSFRSKAPNKTPTFLMSETAHIAFYRHMSDLDAHIITIKNNADGIMDVDDLRQKIAQNKNNIAAIIISLPSYSIGAYDDIKTISLIALENNIPLQVDGCLGGYVIPFLKSPITIDLSHNDYAGITSVSMDTHKYGFSQKGLSFLAYKKSQFTHAPLPICQNRSSTHLEVGLACMLHIGRKGYQQRAENIVELAKQLILKMSEMSELEILGRPKEGDTPHFVIAFHLKDGLRQHTYTLASFMKKLGWHLSQISNQTLHIALTNAHANNEKFLGKFINDLRFSIDLIKNNPHLAPSSTVAVYGMAGSLRGVSGNNLTQKELLKFILKLYPELIMGY